MFPDKLTPEVKVANGGEIYVPNLSMWEVLFRAGSFRGRKLVAADMGDLVKMYLDLATRYSQFSLGFSALPEGQDSWMLCMLLDTPLGLQRVHIEYLECEACGWYGPTANPMVPDLYIGIQDKWEQMRNAERHPVLPCPKCHNKLPRHPIWVEPLAELSR